MPSYKMNRINEEVRRALSEIVREAKDPRITPMISIVDVDVTSDLKYATIYISDIRGDQHTAKTVENLKKASGFLRHELGEKVALRRLPELIFKEDHSISHGMKINDLLNEIKNGR